MSYSASRDRQVFTCPQCLGVGYIDDESSVLQTVECPTCHGQKTVDRQVYRRYLQKQMNENNDASASTSSTDKSTSPEDSKDASESSQAEKDKADKAEKDAIEREKARRKLDPDSPEAMADETVVSCPRCRGVGRIFGPDGKMVTCILCAGSGKVGSVTKKMWQDVQNVSRTRR